MTAGGAHAWSNRGDAEQSIMAMRRVGVEAGVVVDAALEANPVALIIGEVTMALEAGSQSVDFHVASRIGRSRS